MYDFPDAKIDNIRFICKHAARQFVLTGRLLSGQAVGLRRDSVRKSATCFTPAPPTICFVLPRQNSHLAGPNPYPGPGVDRLSEARCLPGICALPKKLKRMTLCKIYFINLQSVFYKIVYV